MKIILSLALVTAFVLPLTAQEYELLFHRPTKIGNKRVERIIISHTQEQEITINGKPGPKKGSENIQATIEAETEDMTVNPNGLTSEIQMKVRSASCRMDGVETPLLSAGDVVAGKAGKPQWFSVNGVPATPTQLRLLNLVYHLADAKKVNEDDKVFGPGHVVKVGDTWLLNSKEAADSTSRFGAQFPADRFKGAMTLKSTGKVLGMDSARVEGHMEMDGSGLPPPGMPPEFKADKFLAVMKMGGDFPLDRTLPQATSILEMSVEGSGKGTVERNGQSMEIEFRITKFDKQETTLLESR